MGWIRLLLLAGCLLPGAVGAAVKVEVWPQHLVPGAPFSIRVPDDPAGGRVRGRFLGHDLPFVRRAGGWLAFAGVDLDVKPGAYPLEVERTASPGSGPAAVMVSLNVSPKTFPVEELEVAPRYVEPPLKVARRIASEAAALKSLWTSATPDFLWGRHLVRPLEGVPGRNFGRRRIFNGEPRSPHSGTDLAAAAGTRVPAAAAGRVVLAEEQYFSGNLVVLDHGGGIYTLYAHLSRLDVVASEDVEAGASLGLVGATGRVTGPHLHWGAHLGTARVDPQALLNLLRHTASDDPALPPAGTARNPT